MADKGKDEERTSHMISCPLLSKASIILLVITKTNPIINTKKYQTNCVGKIVEFSTVEF